MILSYDNVLYRRPDLHDALADPAKPGIIRVLARRYAPHAITLLDLGCGTGFDLAHLHQDYAGTGIEIQESMLTYARRVRSHLHLRMGDLRTVRLPDTFDVITCVGHTLTCLHEADDRRAAFATFAAHAHPGTLLIVHTLIAPLPPVHERPDRITAAGLSAHVTTSVDWEYDTGRSILHRQWRFADGTTADDVVARQVIGPADLHELCIGAGFEVLDMATDPQHPGRLDGPSAWTVARKPP